MTAALRVEQAGAELSYRARGDGVPLIALHGAYSTGAEVEAVLEPIVARMPLRRVYPDLPGHGASRPSSVRDPDHALALLARLVETEAPDRVFLVLGHSFGGQFARALAERFAATVAGLALFNSVVPGDGEVPAPTVIRDDGVSARLHDETRGEYEGYFAVRTDATLTAFEAAVVPSLGQADNETVGRTVEASVDALALGRATVTAPVLVVSGREDAVVGWRRQAALADTYPHATVVTVSGAGHALVHEHPALVASLVREWLAATGVAQIE